MNISKVWEAIVEMNFGKLDMNIGVCWQMLEEIGYRTDKVDTKLDLIWTDLD